MATRADEDLEAAIALLRAQVRRVGVPSAATSEIGVAVEMVVEEAYRALGVNRTKVDVQTLHKVVAAGTSVGIHPGSYANLIAAYAKRNLSSHPNDLRARITHDNVVASLEAVIGDLRQLTSDLENTDFASRLHDRFRRHYGQVVFDPAPALPMAKARHAGGMESPSRSETTQPQGLLRRRLSWLVGIGLFLAIADLAIGGIHSAAASGPSIISRWTVGSRWVFVTSTVVPPNFPDEDRASSGRMERTLDAIEASADATVLRFTDRGGDTDTREQKVVWRVTDRCIESLSSRTDRVKTRACNPSVTETGALRFEGERWTVELDIEGGLRELAWRHAEGYETRKRLAYASINGHEFGTRAEPLTCDWQHSLDGAELDGSAVRLPDGLACRAIVVRPTSPVLRCRDGDQTFVAAGTVVAIKDWVGAAGDVWIAIQHRSPGATLVDICHVTASRHSCRRMTTTDAANDHRLWLVDDAQECRIRILEKRRRAGARKVATWSLQDDEPRRTGGSLAVRESGLAEAERP